MKTKWIAMMGICFATLLAVQAGQPDPVITDDFESYLPGEYPKRAFFHGWGGSDGVLGKFAFVTNTEGYQSEKSLCVIMLPESEMCGIGFGNSVGSCERGFTTFEFDFMREQHGSMSFEIRERFMRWTAGGLGATCSVGGRNVRGSRDVAPIKPFQWYHVKVRMPITKEDAPHGTVTLTDYETGETSEGQIANCYPEGSNGYIVMFNFFNRSKDRHTFYLDNLRVAFQQP